MGNSREWGGRQTGTTREEPGDERAEAAASELQATTTHAHIAIMS